MSKFSDATLYLAPSGYKEGILFPQKPLSTNGEISFTRASSAWRTNIEGQIEETCYNLLQYSEEFDNATWSKPFGWTVTANATKSPNGNTTADLITPTNFNNISQSSVVTASTNYAVSIYVKRNTTNATWVSLIFSGGTSINYGYAINWSTLSISLIPARTAAVNPTFESIGNDWYRISFVCASENNTSASLQIIPDTTAGTNSIYLWGAQLVQGALPKPYLYTSTRQNFPRVDYSLGTGTFLLEPQRTNLLQYSQDFPSVLDKGSVVTVTSNTTIAPDGTLTADTLTANGTGTLFVRANIYGGTTQPCSNSVFVKKNNHRYVGFRNNGSNSLHDVFDFDTKTWTNNSGSTLSYDELPNGWFRLKSTNNLGVANYYWSVLPALNTSGVESTTVSDLSIYIWGGQAEQNANYVSTYIPTTSSAVTRIADSFSRGNIYTNNLVGASGGTWFIELKNNVAYRGDAAGDGIFLRTVGDTDNFRFYSDNSSTSRIYIFKRVSNVNSQLYLTASDTLKVAIKWNGSTADIFLNGTKIVSATTFPATQLQEFATSIVSAPKIIQQMALWRTPLTDAQCQELTL